MTDKISAKARVQALIDRDNYLAPYHSILEGRLSRFDNLVSRLTGEEGRRLYDISDGHDYFGLHFQDNEWIFREWAPNAAAIHLIGNMTGWRQEKTFAL